MRELALDRPEVEPRVLEAWAIHLGYEVSDPGDLRAGLVRGSLPEVIAETARKRGGHPALGVDGRTVTHAELDAAAARAASGISRLGAGPDSTVLLVAAVGLEEIAAYLGTLRVGATVVLANPVMTVTELDELAKSSGARWVLGSGSGLAACAKMSGGELGEIVGLRPEDAARSTVQLDEIVTGEAAVEPVEPDAMAILAFTSGTTGPPKATPLTHANLLSSVRGAMWAWRWSQRDHLVHALPISHQHGLSGVHATLLAGSRATLLESLDPEALLATMENGAATIHFGVPATYQRLVDRLEERALALSRLRLAVSGSGPLPIDLADRYQAAVGRTLLERYGTTESGLDISNPYDGDRVAGRVGLPLPGVEVALVDERGNLVEAAEPGEILIRGPQVFGGYLGVPPSDQPFVDGWFASGDIGAVDPLTGYLSIVGRRKEVIITGGMNVYPREVEDVIRRLGSVTDVAVVGVESARWGEEVVAVVSPVGLDPDEVMATVTNRLAPYKRPKRVVVVEEIPRSPVGKVDQHSIRQLLPPGDPQNPPGGIGSPPQTSSRRDSWI